MLPLKGWQIFWRQVSLLETIWYGLQKVPKRAPRTIFDKFSIFEEFLISIEKIPSFKSRPDVIISLSFLSLKSFGNSKGNSGIEFIMQDFRFLCACGESIWKLNIEVYQCFMTMFEIWLESLSNNAFRKKLFCKVFFIKV